MSVVRPIGSFCALYYLWNFSMMNNINDHLRIPHTYYFETVNQICMAQSFLSLVTCLSLDLLSHSVPDGRFLHRDKTRIFMVVSPYLVRGNSKLYKAPLYLNS